MSVQAYDQYSEETYEAAEVDDEGLMDTVGLLRQEMCTIISDLQNVLKENVKLKREIGTFNKKSSHDRPLSDLHRVKEEIDQLSRMYEKSRSHKPRPRPVVRRQDSFKKIMMMMLLSEML